MADEIYAADLEILQTAYAEKVREAFKVFAENLGTGQSQKSSLDRFVRTLDLLRKARDLALDAAVGGTVLVEHAVPSAAAGAAAEAGASDADGLSDEHRAMIEQALAGTTGQKPLQRR